MRTPIGAWIAAMAACATPSAAAVISAENAGFVVETQVEITARPDTVWRTLGKPSRWWNSDHTYSSDAGNLRLEMRAGGCFCERWAAGQVEHLRVVYAEPGKSLRLTGGLGPLQGMADGAMTFALEPAGAGTKLTLRYQVWGYQPGGFAAIAPAVDGVLSEQLARLKAASEAP